MIPRLCFNVINMYVVFDILYNWAKGIKVDLS